MKHVVSLLLTIIVLAGCTSTNLQSRTYVKPGENLTEMKRYTWAEKDSLSFLGVLYGSDHEALAAKLKSQTTKALSAEGYQFVAADKDPQFRLSIVAGAMAQMEQTETSFSEGSIHLHNDISGSLNNEHFQGGLSLVFMNLSGEDILWQSTATQKIKNRDMGNQDGSIMVKLLGIIMATLPSNQST
jgi:hypothetical protein